MFLVVAKKFGKNITLTVQVVDNDVKKQLSQISEMESSRPHLGDIWDGKHRRYDCSRTLRTQVNKTLWCVLQQMNNLQCSG